MTLLVRSLADQLVDVVRDRILAGEVPADRPIKQDKLAAELGVSKIPLREALARLEEDGLIVSQPNRGFFLRPLTTAEAEEVYALRLKLEPDAMQVAATRATEQERQAAIEALNRVDGVVDAGDDEVGAYNRAFHMALVRPSRQNITIAIINRLQVMSERYVRKHLEPIGRDVRASEEHRQMLEAWLVRGDIAGLARDHLGTTLAELRGQLAAEG